VSTNQLAPSVPGVDGFDLDAVMIGRAHLWGLAANGQAGVENVLDISRNGIDATLLGLGRSSVGELVTNDLIIPPDFARVLGAPAVAKAPLLADRTG
jgi:hypothetical protein